MQERYVVRWVPTEAVTRAATEAGWNAESGASFWDYIDQYDCEESKILPTFEAAQKFADDMLPNDICGAPRIVRQRHEVDDTDFFPMHRWEDRGEWEVGVGGQLQELIS
jgi:hypothetical protein